jgi:arylsulfatase
MEVSKHAIDFIERQVKADKPFFCWWNSTRMHINTHLKKESQGVTGLGVYPDGMVEHDKSVGELLDKLDALGITDNTIVMYSTDNGAECLSWPDGGATPFRGEKDTNWEGGWRVPTLIRWPGVIKPGTVSNEIFSHQDMLPTLLAAAGEPDIVAKVKKGYKAGDKTFKVYLDGFNLLPHFKGEAPNPRPGFMYWSDEGDLMALRMGNWKVHFSLQRAEGANAWQEPLVPLRFPMLFNLRTDPFEEAEISSMYYWKWRVDHVFALAPFGALVAQYMGTMKEFPPRQAPESWSPQGFLEKLREKQEALESGKGVGVK